MLHVLLTGEDSGYYADYADRPADKLARCLAEGFVYQGEHSPYLGAAARQPQRASAAAPPSCCSCRTTTRSATARSASG